MITITRKLELDYGHRLVGHESKCRHVHGHRGVVEVEVTAPNLDQLGRVIDFGVLKSVLGQWLDSYWDHAFIYQEGDPIGEWLEENDMRRYELKTPPTAENLAQHLLDVFGEILFKHDIMITGIKFWETPNCFAVARP